MDYMDQVIRRRREREEKTEIIKSKKYKVLCNMRLNASSHLITPFMSPSEAPDRSPDSLLTVTVSPDRRSVT
jgi:hypothetical protein